MYGVGSPQKRERTGTRSSRQTATWSSTGKWRSRFTPNGLAVSARTRRISSRKTGGGQSCACNMPRPPALLTAATNSGPVRSGPSGAAMIGCSIPRILQSSVFMNTPGLNHTATRPDRGGFLLRLSFEVCPETITFVRQNTMSAPRKTAIVTGASQGIGAGIVNELFERGTNVVAKIVDTALSRFQSIDVVINNAGIFLTKP